MTLQARAPGEAAGPDFAWAHLSVILVQMLGGDLNAADMWPLSTEGLLGLQYEHTTWIIGAPDEVDLHTIISLLICAAAHWL